MELEEPTPIADRFHIQASPAVAAIQKLVLKHEESFLVSDRAGDFPAHFEGELGFYYQGTRHLRWLELRLSGQRPLPLGAEVSPEGDEILIGMTNADVQTTACTVPRNTIYFDRVISFAGPHLRHSFTVSSFHDAPCELTLELIFAADFRDVFEVRGMHRPARGHVVPDQQDATTVRMRYRGLDAVTRATEVRFDPAPVVVAASRAIYHIALAPNARQRIDVTITASNSESESPRPPEPGGALKRSGRRATLRNQSAQIETDNETFNSLLNRSLVDLEMLLTDTPHGRIPYAGVPWYVAPFGRDSLITALQLLPYNADVAASTLRFLAAWQGKTTDAFVDEEPGKILHEYRRGEMANCREIPFIPYYGTIDATPLFVLLLGEYVRWTADTALARTLWPAARAAFRWMEEWGDRDHDGYLEYQTSSHLGLGNQGWKDSEDSVSHGDGTLARQPIALVEVQGYAYAALRAGAELAELLGESVEAAALGARADTLRDAFNRDFWMEDEGYYALALDGDKRPCEVISSNPGHCLWTGIVDERRAPTVAKRMLADDTFSGWGIRTLSARERRYNPMSYHNGSVWPHDNAIAAAGFRRYRLAPAVVTVTTGLYEAARYFEHARLPELFCGFPRQNDYGPISYPVACAPQAWAAGSVLQLVTALVGLEPEAPGGRLTFHTSILPPWLRFVEIRNLRVGSSSLDVAIHRGRDSASVELLSRRGDVELIVRR